MLLQEIGWKTAAEKFEKDNKEKGYCLVIIPTGSTEQHGAHMPLGTDFYMASSIAKDLGEKLDCLVMPSVNYGHCAWHTDFAGTINFDLELLYQIYYKIASQCIKWGATHIMFVNGHGGNTAALNRVSMDLRSDFNVLCYTIDWWKVTGTINPDWVEKGHGGVPETSAMLYYHPDIVHMEYAPVCEFVELNEKIKANNIGQFYYNYKGKDIPMNIYTRTGDITKVGAFGDTPSAATAEFGETLICYVRRFFKYILTRIR